VVEQVSGVSVNQLARPFAFESPFHGEDFALLLVVSVKDVTADEQRELSEAFVAQGCRYAVCTGVRASEWDDSIDHASVVAELDGLRPEDRLVMTAWHDDEPLVEVARFFFEHTAFEDFVPERRLAVLLGGSRDELDELRGTLTRVAGGPTRG
jgi:hypothetical protein